MTCVLILGANGQLAHNATRVLLRESDATLTLYLRRARRLANPDPARVTIVEGDVLDLREPNLTNHSILRSPSCVQPSCFVPATSAWRTCLTRVSWNLLTR